MGHDCTRLLVIGAGPFGLSLAAYADHLGIDNRVHGVPMGFWHHHMPAGMLLRSGRDWHLDATERDTIDAYLATQGLAPADVEPLSLDFYLSYTTWFSSRRNLRPDPRLVVGLDLEGDVFAARLEDGTRVQADNVALALGFGHFANVPDELAALLPPGSYRHTCDLVDLGDAGGRRYLVVGGRQSAFEWAALLHEAGAASVDVCHRHPSPAFAESDWSWVSPLVDAMVDDPGWYRRLTPEERNEVDLRLWGEGRLKVEPWLRDRLDTATVRIRPETCVSRAERLAGGGVRVLLDDASTIDVDEVVLATGYRPDVTRIPLLVAGNVLPTLQTRNRLPVLDETFQTSVPGLFVTSMLAVQDFGPFFAFTGAVRTSTRVIGHALMRQARPLTGTA